MHVYEILVNRTPELHSSKVSTQVAMSCIPTTTTIFKYQHIFFQHFISFDLCQKKADKNGNVIPEKSIFATVVTSPQ